MTGRVEEDELDEFVEDDLVFDDDILTWGSVARAFGEEEERFNLRSRMGPLGQATGTSSSSQHDGDENDKENDEGYKSCDDNDDGPSLNEDNDYVD